MTPGLSLLARLTVSWSASAADGMPASDPAVPAIPDIASMFGRMLLIVGVLCGLMLVAAWWLRRIGRVRGAGAGMMRVVDTLELGQGRRLMLVEVQGRTRLIGVTPQSITNLSDDAAAPHAASAPGVEAPPTFADVFRGPGWAGRREAGGAGAAGPSLAAGPGGAGGG